MIMDSTEGKTIILYRNLRRVLKAWLGIEINITIMSESSPFMATYLYGVEANRQTS